MGVTMMDSNLAYPQRPVYLSTDRTAGLHLLLRYAISHQHTRGWIAPLARLLQHVRPGREVQDD
jgi:hypothetical protein